MHFSGQNLQITPEVFFDKVYMGRILGTAPVKSQKKSILGDLE